VPSATLAARLTFGAGTLGVAFLATAGLPGPAGPAAAHPRPAPAALTRLTADRPAARGRPGRLAALAPAAPATAARPALVTGPVVAAASPAEGAPGWLVSLTGRRFRHVTAVSFGGVSAAFTVTSPTRIVTTVPPGAQSGRITVTTGSGRGRSPAFAVTPAQTLEPGETLPSADALTSQDDHYTLTMRGNGNLVYDVSGTTHLLWSSGTAGHPGAYLRMRRNGDLVVSAAHGVAALWSSNTAGQGPARLVAQTDGRLVTYAGPTPTWTAGGYDATLKPGERLRPGWFLSAPNGDTLTMAATGDLIETGPAGPLWSTNTAGHDGARLIMAAGGNLILRGPARTLWSSGTAGHPGARLVLQATGVLAVRDQGHVLWASHPAATTPPTQLTLGRWAGRAGTRAADTYYGYPYSDPPPCTDHGACVADQWAFYRGQCTSWVAYRLNVVNGIAFTNAYGGVGTWGDAVHWGAQARKLKIMVNGTPAVGSIAWYAATKAAPDGHVAYVEQVNSPTSFVTSEMNYDADNGFWVHTITRATGDWPTGFIHLTGR
jgi:surface antigen